MSSNTSEETSFTDFPFHLVGETIDSSDVGVFVLDSDFSVVWINNTAEDFFELSREEILGRKKIDLIESSLQHTFEKPKLLSKRLKKSYKANTDIESFECHVLPSEQRKERRLRHISTSIEDGPLAGGRLELYLDVSRFHDDQWDQNLFHQLLDHTHDEIYLIDTDTAEIIDVNQTACRRLNYDRQELLDKTLPEVETTIEGNVDWEHQVRALQENRSQLIEGRHVTADGETYPVELNVVPVELGRDYLLVVARDMTEQRKVEKALRESKAHLKHAQSVAELGSWHLDVDSNELQWSEEVYSLFELPRNEDMTFEKFLTFVHPADRAAVEEKWNTAVTEASPESSYDIEHRIVVGDDIKWVHERAEINVDENGDPVEGIGVVQDITSRKKREQRIEDLSDTLETIRRVNRRLVRSESPADVVPDVAKILSEHNHFECTFLALLDQDRIERVCKAHSELIPEEVQQFHTERYIDTVLDQEMLHLNDVTSPPFRQHFSDIPPHEGLALSIRHESNHYGVLTLHYPPGDSPTDEEKDLLKDLARDIAFSMRAIEDRARLEKRSITDSLTGLHNRGFFVEKLSETLNEDEAGAGSHTLFCIDLKRFDRINTSLGYTAGDEVLKICARRIQKIVPDDCIVARLSGDEFQVLLKDVRRVEEAEQLGRDILNEINRRIEFDDHTFHIGGRIGIARAPDNANNAEDLIGRAYEAQKRTGDEPSSQIEFYSDRRDDEIFNWTLQLEEDFKQALKDRDLELYYQPQVSVDTEEIRGVETLLRWNHPDKGFIPPTNLINRARTIGRLNELGQWILRQASRQLKEWNQTCPQPIQVSVNVAPAEFLQGPDYLDTIDRILEETDIHPSQLEIEITERQAIEDFEYTADILHSIEDRNLSISMDDFGTGYSSMRYFSALPLDVVKIDRSFIVDLEDDPTARRLVQSIIDIARDLEIEVIAEGVDNSAQRSLLREFGCDCYQGFYHSRPAPPDEINHLLTPTNESNPD